MSWLIPLCLAREVGDGPHGDCSWRDPDNSIWQVFVDLDTGIAHTYCAYDPAFGSHTLDADELPEAS